MTATPQTRNSLILRLRDRDDVDSWREFVAIYEPVIYRVATGRGLQHADALELVQRVLIAVARAVDRFQPDQSRARFRTWLYRITHNEFCKEYATSCKQVATGDSQIQALLYQQPENEAADFTLEFRRAVFRWAADRVRTTVKPSTWQAFWQTSVAGDPIDVVAESLGVSSGTVYLARSRVMKKLQEEARRYEEDHDEV